MARKIGAPAQQPRLPASGPGNRDAAIAVFRFRYAPPPVGNGQGVTTGHISLYYSSPWYDLDFQLRVGQYLARDRGVTLQVTWRFSTGVEIGAFFTKTNVSAAQFGEGSFDKGLIIRAPLDYIAPIESQSHVAVDLRPVQRDGGQFLAGDAALIEETRRGSEGEFAHQSISFANE
jgi:hypothetical protein